MSRKSRQSSSESIIEDLLVVLTKKVSISSPEPVIAYFGVLWYKQLSYEHKNPSGLAIEGRFLLNTEMLNSSFRLFSGVPSFLKLILSQKLRGLVLYISPHQCLALKQRATRCQFVEDFTRCQFVEDVTRLKFVWPSAIVYLRSP